MNPTELVQLTKEQIEHTANVRAVFGEPIEKNGVTIIPVARVRVAGGGGGGTGKSQQEEQGTGGGLGFRATAFPVGFIQVTGHEAVFKRTFDLTRLALSGLVAGVISLFFLSRALRARR